MNLVRRLARLAFGNAFSLVYLALVAAAMLFALVEHRLAEQSNPSLSGVWMLLLTMPTILAALPLLDGGGSAILAYGTVAAVALVHAVGIGLAVRVLRDVARRRTARPYHAGGGAGG